VEQKKKTKKNEEQTLLALYARNGNQKGKTNHRKRKDKKEVLR
jgi:hypothetical protein